MSPVSIPAVSYTHLDVYKRQVRDGQIVLADKGGRQIMRIPSCLRGELLDYIGRMDIRSGPVFVTRSGKHINRTAVAAHIQGLAPVSYTHLRL